MQRGDFAFYAPNPDDPVDRLILAVQAAAGDCSPFQHVEIALDDWFLVGAIWPTVRLGTLDLLTPAAIVSPRYSTPDGARLAATFAAKQVGRGYNAPGVALLGAGLLVPAWKQRLLQGAQAFDEHLAFCSQLAASAYLAGGGVLDDPAAWTSVAALHRQVAAGAGAP